jgi:large repetitive protein
MDYLVSNALRRWHLTVLALVFALSVGACGQVGVSNSGSALTNSNSVPTPGSGTTQPSAPPVISGTPATSIVAGQSYSFTPTASDGSGSRSLTFSIANKPEWASFDGTSGRLSGTPSAASVGTFANIQISVSDGQTSAALDAFAITVVAPLGISGSPSVAATVGSSYSFQPTVSAPPGTTLVFSILNTPSWATFNASTGELSGTPTRTGSFPNIVISVSDGFQSSALTAFSITVSSPNPTNNPPTISGQPQTGATAGSLYSFTPTASDPSGRALTFSVQNLPPWASFSTANGTLTGTPAAAQVGTYSGIVIGVSDGSLSASLPAFAIKVVASLSISGSPPTQVVAGQSYSFQPTTNAPSGTALTFSIQNRPVWATFSASSGMLSGTPTSTQAGTYSNIVVSVSNGVQTVALAGFAIRVVTQLTISGNPATQVAAGKSYAFQPTTNATSGTALTFSIQNKPSWATFSASTGALSGTPSTTQVGTYANIAIGVSSGTQSANLGAFSITVTNPSNPTPTISGNPPTSVNVLSAYSFTPAASGPSGTTLTFSIQNKPAWASFNTANGALTGTPAAASAGTYSNIVISVSDGSASASLPTFSITVNQVSNGTASLDWTAVTQNTNGTAIVGLAGYKVFYGTSPSAMNTVVVLSNPTVTTYLVTNLSSGTWYFGVAAYTSSGTQGALSNVGQKTIQ